jgi:FAD:protein FMN transferase
MESVHRFRAMNTDIQVVIAGESEETATAASREVESIFAETEEALSRFRPESELSALNGSAGRPFRASRLLLQAIAEALAAARETDGLFDPTILNALVAAGYDRSFELLNDRDYVSGSRSMVSPSPTPPLPASSSHAASWQDVAVDWNAGTITLPVGVGLDLGGVGKGWTVDRAALMLRRFENYVVDAGGDIYASGAQDDGTSWTVGVQDPSDPDRDLAVLEVRGQAVVTSTTSRRRWTHNGKEQHHIIDPRTGHPANTGVVSITVVANSAARAETLAKAALLLGPRQGVDFLQKRGVEGVLVLDEGRLEFTPTLRKEMEHAS